MIFGEFPLKGAEGLVLAHSVQLPSGRLPKGQRLTQADILALEAAGLRTVIACRLEDGDLGEDEAAGRLAAGVGLDNLRMSEPSTGRVNFYATRNGLLVASRDLVDRFNRIDPAITFACLADHSDVREGDLVATVKIIPLAVSGASVARALGILAEGRAIELKPYRPRNVALIATQLPSLKTSVMDKTARVLEQRLLASGSRLIGEWRVAHRADAVAGAIEDALRQALSDPPLVIVFGASAVCDPVDVIPESIRMAGGTVDQVGLPVDPGNLLVLGHVGEIPVIGAPGCARSPKENGFDWVLNRILAGENPDALELTGLGVGGLLMEIPSRPLPREAATSADVALRVGIIILAAGRASRMGEGGRHKLLAEFEGVPLIRRVTERALDAAAGPVVVVTGFRAPEISACLEGLPAELQENRDYASGMASSIRAGLAVPSLHDADGVMILLGDMPGITSNDLARLADAFCASAGRSIVRAVADGKRGNPVILPRATFPALMRLEGDIGARHIIETSGLPIVDVEVGAAAKLDVDTPEAVLAAGGVLKG